MIYRLICILLMFLAIMFKGFSQENPDSVHTCFETNGEIFVLNKLWFHSSDHISKQKLSSVKFCNQEVHIYDLDGLVVGESNYIALRLSRNDVVGKDGTYKLIYRDNDSLSCVECIRLIVRTKISYSVNGVRIHKNRKIETLQKIDPIKIVSIKRTYGLFGKGIIDITTL